VANTFLSHALSYSYISVTSHPQFVLQLATINAHVCDVMHIFQWQPMKRLFITLLPRWTIIIRLVHCTGQCFQSFPPSCFWSLRFASSMNCKNWTVGRTGSEATNC